MVGTLSFVSAGAGSGKTYRLTQILHERLSSGQVRPQGVLATTFTRKAATELRERVRKALIEQGEFALASAIGQARIGTVNSVCGGFLERFAFEAGLATVQRVLEETQSGLLVREAIDAVTDGDALQELVACARRLGIDSWEDTLKAILDQARASDIAPERLATFGARNAGELLAHFPAPVGEDLDALLLGALEVALPAIRKGASGKKNTHEYLDLAGQVQERIASGRAVWSDWLRLAKKDPEAGLKTLAQPVTHLAARVIEHPRLHQDIGRYLAALFALAARALDAYAQRKREFGVIDFVDQEHLFLRLLEKPAVVEVLAQELDLLLVDEFQDTSPIQLEVFVRLSRIARESVWVGDVKQAIYGFRGSDAELMKTLLAELPAMGGTREVLGQSRRSRPALVQLVNAAFGEAFSPGLSREEVVLAPVRREQLPEAALAHWMLDGANVVDRAAALAEGIRDLIASTYRIVDPASGVPRPAHYGDIAVLCKTNDRVQAVATALRRAGVPWATQQSGLLATPEAVLALACLRRFNDPRDTLASAEIVSLADCEEPESWLTDRLRYLADGGDSRQWREGEAGGHALLMRLARLRAQAPLLSPRAALELVIVQCELAERVLRWRRNALVGQVRLANLEALLALAQGYEDTCLARREPATVPGLILWLGEQAAAGLDLLAQPPVAAVTIMTHHAAKGLEWPIVILLDLEQEIRDRTWSVAACSQGAFDVKAPLRDRWIRCWPWPFGAQKKAGIADTIAQSPTGLRLRAEAIEEAKRLLYVSMTRARDHLILALPAKRGECEWLGLLEAPWLVPEAAGEALVLPDGSQLARAFRRFQAPAVPPAVAEPEASLRWFPGRERCTERLRATLLASAAAARPCTIVESVAIGERVRLAPATDMTALGNALHACLAAVCTDPAVPLDASQVARILEGFGLQGALAPAAVLRQLAALQAWIASRWPGCPQHAEVPIESVLSTGQVLHGRIDLLLETPEGWVLLDHKANPAPRERWVELTTEYGGQLSLYAGALARATGRAVAEAWLVLPVAAGAIRVSVGEA
ncbi:MAG: UvrD-helicase domain-containing protein [Gammaproteobacteria bacterium]|nr:UvrD-helicase domain-containing protein [Gammaproteobacteria bacterium]